MPPKLTIIGAGPVQLRAASVRALFLAVKFGNMAGQARPPSKSGRIASTSMFGKNCGKSFDSNIGFSKHFQKPCLALCEQVEAGMNGVTGHKPENSGRWSPSAAPGR